MIKTKPTPLEIHGQSFTHISGQVSASKTWPNTWVDNLPHTSSSDGPLYLLYLRVAMIY